MTAAFMEMMLFFIYISIHSYIFSATRYYLLKQ